MENISFSQLPGASLAADFCRVFRKNPYLERAFLKHYLSQLPMRVDKSKVQVRVVISVQSNDLIVWTASTNDGTQGELVLNVGPFADEGKLEERIYQLVR